MRRSTGRGAGDFGRQLSSPGLTDARDEDSAYTAAHGSTGLPDACRPRPHGRLGPGTAAPAPRLLSRGHPRLRSSTLQDEPDVRALQAAMVNGTLTARALTERYLARIEAIDRQGPALRSVIEVNPDALRLADEADAARRQGTRRGAAPRHPDPDQGQHRHGRPDAHDRRLAGARRLDAAARCLPRRAAARRGRGAPRQDQPQRVGELPLDAGRRAAGAAAAARRATRTRSTATRAARAPARAPPWPRTCAPPPSAPRPTARSSARRRRPGSSASSRRSASSAARGSSRSPPARTPPARWRGPSRTPRSC